MEISEIAKSSPEYLFRPSLVGGTYYNFKTNASITANSDKLIQLPTSNILDAILVHLVHNYSITSSCQMKKT